MKTIRWLALIVACTSAPAFSYEPQTSPSFRLFGTASCAAADAKGAKKEGGLLEAIPLRGVSWAQCTKFCSSVRCSGVTYSLDDLESTCSIHQAPLKLGKVKDKEAAHLCWVRPLNNQLPISIEGPDPVGILEEDCTWTNDNRAECIVWDCDEDGVCVEYGEYCVDANGNVGPC